MSLEDTLRLTPIARLRGDLPEKFGIPRQSGLVAGLRAEVVFEPDFRNPDAVRGLAQFSHIWLLWGFHAAQRPAEGWRATVRPPRLGGNTRLGVFATRSPFRPNPVGLSCVELLAVRESAAEGPILEVAGADLLNGTPIYDIKPYLPYADSRPGARGGFAEAASDYRLEVDCPPALLEQLPPEKREALLGVLACDPRPAYQHDPARLYGLRFAGFSVRFTVEEPVLTVREIAPEGSPDGV